MKKQMQEYLDKGIQEFSLEFKEGKQCDIQLCPNGEQYFYLVKSCNDHFELSSMRDAYSTNDFDKACEWISEHAKDFEGLMCFGYDIGENL